jgi:transposase
VRKRYPSDISREQFEKIRPILESARKKTRPRTVDLYDAFCGVLYLLKSGCQWRMLPSDFPKWRTVHAYFQIWSTPGENGESILEEILKKISWRGPTKQWSEYEDELLYR